MSMEQRIQDTLDRIEQMHGVRVLYACESGSRAWGFASPDSDYDVRFIYAGRVEHYLTIGTRRDVIELPIEDDLDINGWDLVKALGLLRASNPTLLEWLHSPQVYRCDEGFLGELRHLAEQAVQPRALCHHYLSMAGNEWSRKLQQGQVTAKRYLYILRTLMCAQWVVTRGAIPPVPFETLVAELVDSAPLQQAIHELLALKVASGEQKQIARQPVLDAFIAGTLTDLEQRVPVAIDKPDIEPFDALLRKALLQQ